MPQEDILNQRKADIRALAAKHGAQNLRVFGSVARREATCESDLDFLVDMEPGRTLLDLIGFSQDLEELLGCSIDVVTEEALSPHLRDRICAEAVPL
jgi:uncharacterized protein